MKKNENLDKYQDSYTTEFKFFDENYYFLSHFASKVCDAIRSESCESVLSLGIGHQIVNGSIRKEFENSLKSYTILEGSLDIINELSGSITEHQDKMDFVHTYFEDYQSEKIFDMIEMGFILEHVDDPALILNKFKSFLKPSGTIFIGVPNARSLHRTIGFEAGLLDDIYKLSEYDLQLGHKRYFDLNSIQQLVIDAGYKIKNICGLLLKPITASQMAKLNWDKKIYEALVKIGDNYPEISNGILIEATI